MLTRRRFLGATAAAAGAGVALGYSWEARASGLFTIKRPDRICVVGDSITEDVNVGGWYRPFMDVVRARYSGSPRARFSKLTGTAGQTLSKATANVIDTSNAQPILVGAGSGISGGQTADILAAWSTLVTAFEPFDTIIIQLGINDWRHSTLEATTVANVQTLCDASHGGKYRDLMFIGPCCGDLGSGEDWSQFSGASQLAIDSLSAAMQTAVTGLGYTYVDWRTPFKALETTAGFNNSHLGQGVFTVDGVHPGPANGQPLANLGQRYMSSWALQKVQFA